VIFDTNVLIYLSKHILKPEKILKEKVSISIITKIEALGFAFQNIEEHNLLLAICNELEVVPLSNQIAEATISLRGKYKVKLPDAIVYASALIEKVPLLTNNINDFKSIGMNVKLINPFDL
jgi:predicted nucleic acid-binding protein